MVVLAYTIAFNALVWMNTDAFRLTKPFSESYDEQSIVRQYYYNLTSC